MDDANAECDNKGHSIEAGHAWCVEVLGCSPSVTLESGQLQMFCFLNREGTFYLLQNHDCAATMVCAAFLLVVLLCLINFVGFPG